MEKKKRRKVRRKEKRKEGKDYIILFLPFLSLLEYKFLGGKFPKHILVFISAQVKVSQKKVWIYY